MGAMFQGRNKVPRVVFDTNTVLSALLFANGALSWLRHHWRHGESVPLISQASASELTRTLSYAKFRLSSQDRMELLGDYLPYCETVEVTERCPHECRDQKDQPFLDLAQSGNADLLVTGDKDLLALIGQTRFLIETPKAYWQRINGGESAS